MSNNNNQPIRNARAFIASYLKSKSGIAALARDDIRVRDNNGKYKTVNRSSAMAQAFKAALSK